jgi:hypothetical protein
MTLEKFLLNISKNNLDKKIYEIFSTSKDIRCQKILIDIIAGKDLYESIANQLDYLCKCLLKNKHSTTLEIVGSYLELKSLYRKTFLVSLIYPVFLFLTNVFIFYFLFSKLSKINLWLLVVLPLSFFLTLVILSNLYIKTKYNLNIKYFFAYSFLKKSLNFSSLQNIYEILKIKLNLEDCVSTEEITYKLMDKKLSNLEQVEEFYTQEKIHMRLLIPRFIASTTVVSLFFSGFFILINILEVFSSIKI